MHVTVRRRKGDGLTEITPNTEPLTLTDRCVAIFTASLVAFGLFLCEAIPFEIFLIVLACCAAAELAIVLKQLFLLRQPIAELHLLPARYRLRR